MFKIKEQKRFSIYSTMLFSLNPDITKLMTPDTLFSVVETYLTTPEAFAVYIVCLQGLKRHRGGNQTKRNTEAVTR